MFNSTALTSITIPATVASIGEDAFLYSELSTVYIENGQLGITSPDQNVTFFGATVNTELPTSNNQPEEPEPEPEPIQFLTSSAISLDESFLQNSDVEFNTSGSGFDTELGLYDETGNIIAQNDDGTGLSNGESKIIYQPTSDGIYYLVIGGYDIIFSNNFTITIPSDTVYGDGTLNFGLEGSISGTRNFTINSTNKYIVYSFNVISEVPPTPSPF